MGNRWRDYYLAFPANDGLPMNPHGKFRQRFKTLLKEAGLPKDGGFSMEFRDTT